MSEPSKAAWEIANECCRVRAGRPFELVEAVATAIQEQMDKVADLIAERDAGWPKLYEKAAKDVEGKIGEAIDIVTAQRDALQETLDAYKEATGIVGKVAYADSLNKALNDVTDERNTLTATVERMREALMKWWRLRESLSADCIPLGIGSGVKDSGKWGEELARRCEPLRNFCLQYFGGNALAERKP